MAITVCIKLPAIPPGYMLTLPGMGELTYLRDSLERMPRPSEMLLKFLNAIAPAMAPVYMLIRVLDVIQAIVNCVLAVKKAITQLSPMPLLKCFSGLFEALAKLLPLIPPIAYLKMIVDIIGLVRMLLEDIMSILGIIDAEITKIRGAITKATATNDTALLNIAECAKHNLVQQAGGLTNILTVIGKLVGTLLIVLDMLAAFMPPETAKEIEKVKEAISGASTAGSQTLEGFPALQPILTTVGLLLDALRTVESLGRAVLGNPVAFVASQVPELQNP